MTIVPNFSRCIVLVTRPTSPVVDGQKIQFFETRRRKVAETCHRKPTIIDNRSLQYATNYKSYCIVVCQ